MKIMDLKKLSKIPEYEVISTDTGVFDQLAGKYAVRWVAKKGGNNDWAIYYHYINKSVDEVARTGVKITNEFLIRTLVPCTDEVFARYRF